MTTEIERQFFNTFGIEPRQRRACIDKHTLCPFPKAECEECYYYQQVLEYPQITDRILLELICIWNNACLYLEDRIAPINYQKVTETVLEYFVDIENYRFAIGKQEIKQQVRTLFKDVNYAIKS